MSSYRRFFRACCVVFYFCATHAIGNLHQDNYYKLEWTNTCWGVNITFHVQPTKFEGKEWYQEIGAPFWGPEKGPLAVAWHALDEMSGDYHWGMKLQPINTVIFDYAYLLKEDLEETGWQEFCDYDDWVGWKHVDQKSTVKFFRCDDYMYIKNGACTRCPAAYSAVDLTNLSASGAVGTQCLSFL